MKNPLEQSVKGQELKDWVWFNSMNHTQFSKLAAGIHEVFNLNNDKFYILKRCGDEIKIVEVSEPNKHYEIPC